ncbi:hypothetical protein ACFV0T_15795 [Streptomyces sp. NPDC059582]|uniref:hypothetical protein n=1 Tax=Streptomyces sp. NPDC059582 TaxID=3346875 RepID=UPI0036C94BC5
MHELVLRVDAGPMASDEQVERQIRSLYRDLHTLGLFNVERKQAPAPAGSMASAGYEIGALVVSGAFSAAALKAMSNVLVAYIQRAKARSVEWEFDGDKGTFQALSAKDQNKLVDVVASRIAAGVSADSGDQEPGDSDGGTPDRAAGRD